MTRTQLKAHAFDQIALCGEDASVVLKVRGRWGKSNTRRLWKGGPTATIMSEEHDGTIVLMCKANDILRALEVSNA